MRRRPIALGVSLVAHVGLALVVLSTARMDADESPRTVQLNGTRQDRQAGRDVLLDVLRGEGMPIHLASATGDAAVGLALWTPSVGMWLAIDRLPSAYAARSLQVSMQVGRGTPKAIGTMNIDEDGSGRIVAAWVNERPAPGTPITLTVSERDSVWGWRQPSPALTGTSPMREQRRPK